jgi:hypothetical protein
MLRGDADGFERTLGLLRKSAMSVFDFGVRAVEAVYQAFIIGLLLHLDPSHIVRSNREEACGRADVTVRPLQPGAGAVLELKVINPDDDAASDAERALQAAVRQLTERGYAAGLFAGGATVVHQFAVVFDGKCCRVRGVQPP